MSYPNRYPYRGITYPTIDLFFTARVESFEPARALSEVEALVICSPKQVAPEELAFESLRQALRYYDANR